MSELSAHPADPVLRRYLTECQATAFIGAPSAVEDAPERLATESKKAHKATTDIADSTVADRLVTALEAHGHSLGRTLVGVVDSERTHVWHMEEAVSTEVFGGPLPALTRLLAARQTWLPHAVVKLDSAGADVHMVRAAEGVTSDAAGSHLTRANPGGWSEESVEHLSGDGAEDTAKEVANRLTELVRHTPIDLVLLSGQPDEVARLRDDLTAQIDQQVVTLESGGRATDGSDDVIDEAVDTAVRQAAATARAEIQRDTLETVAQGQGATE